MVDYRKQNRRNRKNKKRSRWIRQHRALIYTGSVIVILAVLSGVFLKLHTGNNRSNNFHSVSSEEDNPIPRPQLDVQLLTVNEYSRPGTALEEVRGIVIHYTANPGSTAIQNRNYFEGLKDSGATKASSHFVIGLKGEIVQCIPSTEISYASNSENYETLSIECCHEDEGGKFNRRTYDSLVHLTAWLCVQFDVEVDRVIRHYDVTGKNCPKYYVENNKAWKKFKTDVKDYIDKYVD